MQAASTISFVDDMDNRTPN